MGVPVTLIVKTALNRVNGVPLTTFRGETNMATADQVRAIARGGSARIQR